MNIKQIFDLTSPLQQNLILHKSWLYTAIIMQNKMAMQWQVPKERKYHNQMWFWRKVLRSSKASYGRKEKTNIIQARQMSIWNMAKKCRWKVEICCQSTLSTWHLGRPVILPQIAVAQFALEIQSYCKEEEEPWGHPIILLVGTLPDLNWLKMQILGIIVVTALWEEWATTPRPVLNLPESC